MTSFRSFTPPLLLLTGIFFLNFIGRILIGPLLLPLTEEFGLSISRVGLLFVLLSGGYSIAVLLAGTVSARVGHHASITVSMFILGLTLLWTGYAESFSAVLAAQFVLGFGAGFYLPSGVATISDMVSSKHWGKAFALHELAPTLSFILAPILVEFFLTGYSWRTLYICLGVACLVYAPLYFFKGRYGKFKGQFPRFSNFSRVAGLFRFQVVTLGLILAVGSEIGVYNLVPAYLVTDLGMSRESANLLLAASRVTCLPATVAAGWFVDRVGLRRSMLAFLLLTALATSGLAAPSSAVVGTLLFLQPVVVLGMFPATFSALSRIAPPGMNDLAVSLSVACASVIGGGIIPAALAGLGEQLGFPCTFVLLSLVICATMIPFRIIDLDGDNA